MYLVEIKSGDVKIRKYVLNNEYLEQLIKENPQYEYVKIIEDTNNKVKRKIKRK